MFLLDTNVISELRRAKSGRTDKHVLAWATSVPQATLFLSVISLLELEMGVLSVARRDMAQGAMLRDWLDGHVLPAFAGRILDVDAAVTLCCARLRVSSSCAERDALIAATAIVHGMTVVTRNVVDFVATGAALFNPWDAAR